LTLVLAASAAEFLDLSVWPGLILAGLVLSLVAGFATRPIALSASVVGLVMLVTDDRAMPILLLGQSIDAMALALLGPGAYSIDARLFGRATITLPR
jgi:hypothetical protein